MSWLNDKVTAMSQGARAVTAIALIAVGAVGGASAASLTRPPIEMAPTTPTPAAKLAAATGIVSVKGKVTDIYGDRFVVEDSSGRTMIDAGRDAGLTLTKGTTISVQGRYDESQLRASFITTADGQVVAVGRRGPHGDRHGKRGRPEHGPEGPPPPIDGTASPAPAPARANEAPPPASAPKS